MHSFCPFCSSLEQNLFNWLFSHVTRVPHAVLHGYKFVKHPMSSPALLMRLLSQAAVDHPSRRFVRVSPSSAAPTAALLRPRIPSLLGRIRSTPTNVDSWLITPHRTGLAPMATGRGLQARRLSVLRAPEAWAGLAAAVVNS
jgi:hypothetical protein